MKKNQQVQQRLQKELIKLRDKARIYREHLLSDLGDALYKQKIEGYIEKLLLVSKYDEVDIIRTLHFLIVKCDEENALTRKYTYLDSIYFMAAYYELHHSKYVNKYIMSGGSLEEEAVC